LFCGAPGTLVEAANGARTVAREPSALWLRVHPDRRPRGGRSTSSTIAEKLTGAALGLLILLAGLLTLTLGLLLALKVAAVDLRSRLRLVLLALAPLIELLFFVTAESIDSTSTIRVDSATAARAAAGLADRPRL